MGPNQQQIGDTWHFPHKNNYLKTTLAYGYNNATSSLTLLCQVFTENIDRAGLILTTLFILFSVVYTT
jgi:hypothetical protein